MGHQRQRSRCSPAVWLGLSLLACTSVAGCTDEEVHPSSGDPGLLESPTHEADSMREEERQRGDVGG